MDRGNAMLYIKGLVMKGFFKFNSLKKNSILNYGLHYF